ncbi:MAG: hypothetical protein RJA34_1715 [Pseudomonadota bacterium]
MKKTSKPKSQANKSPSVMQWLWRWLLLVLLAGLSLEVFFVGRIALMAVVDPQSTAFQRSEAWRLATDKDHLRWRQQWVDYSQISDHLKRAVIASEDDGFSQHDGVDWDALEKAWAKNARAEERAEKQTTKAGNNTKAKPPKVVGGSTITQQLAKNLLLSGERTLFRKGQELVLTFTLEQLLSKRRILEIYLNSVEWGEGVFGAEAAAQHYYRKPAAKLSAYEAARLAVMLPRPRFFEKTPQSGYLSSRAEVITARMPNALLP